ncbi:hypothetical protein SAMD00019534_005110 [Acytostelium subglobosum LB1]|uniref:hypothetical protein n=1 Tax=Acytostelium subglobosum LB1 TaxID=1410327 RepID=UPI000644821B|nr:hypothetical protein SAMD00019534_005110 [Acytostelium subglobosum LB1]GAM17336.1 hypothetical protein SAMD00019534_005110 [Acytostelium subglobosum LB1]|eukprot:XP_012759398.1 hypothetical protein SAMD00019534_005110 [Acytostelium subglobosum LB1]
MSTTNGKKESTVATTVAATTDTGDTILLEAQLEQDEKKLNQLLTFVKEERDKGNTRLNKSREELQALNNKLDQLKESMAANVCYCNEVDVKMAGLLTDIVMTQSKQTKNECIELKKQLYELQQKTAVSETQIQTIITASSVPQDELVKLKDEARANLLYIQEKYQQLQKESKAREDDLKNTFFLLNEQEKTLKGQLS